MTLLRITKMKNEKKFYKNLEIWAHTNPQKAVLLPYVDCEGITFCNTNAGEINLEKRIKDQIEYYHSPQGAFQEAEEWFKSLNLDKIQVLFVYGIGLGYYLDVAKDWLKKNHERTLVFLEDELPVIHRLFETEKGTEVLSHPQVQLHYFQDLNSPSSKEVFELLYWNFIMSGIKVSALKYYARKKEGFFAEIHHKILYDASVKNALLDEYLKYGAAFFKNFYPNMLSLEGSYSGNNLFGKFNKIPAIICGAGPCLEKQLPLLTELKDKALIFAGGSSLNALNASNILPHFGAGIDPNDPQLDRMNKNQAFEVPFFYRNRMYHAAFKMIHGPRLYITGSGGYDVSDWFEEKLKIQGKLLDEGHNVVNFCVEVANALGCDPIIFIGMDLAFTKMKSYSPGVIEDVQVVEEELLKDENFDGAALLRKDVNGEPIYTLWKWIAEADWIGDFAKEHTDITLINCTEGGIGFPGIANQTLAETAKKYLSKTYDLQGHVQGEIQASPLPQVKKKKIIKLIKELQESLKRCVNDFQVLLEEAEQVKEKVKKSKIIPLSAQSGRAALCEADLAEETGYKYILEIFNDAYSRVLSRELHQIKASRLSETKKFIKRLELNGKRFAFLRDVALVNSQLIQLALEDKL